MLRLRNEFYEVGGIVVLGNHNQNDGGAFPTKIRFIHVATNPAADETIVVGTKTYTFKDSGATGDQINIGADVNYTALNIIAKINIDEAACQCHAYPMEDASQLMLVALVVGASPTFTADGTKVVATIGWTNTLDQADVEANFKIAVGQPSVGPTILVERNPGTYQNFLY